MKILLSYGYDAKPLLVEHIKYCSELFWNQSSREV